MHILDPSTVLWTTLLADHTIGHLPHLSLLLLLHYLILNEVVDGAGSSIKDVGVVSVCQHVSLGSGSLARKPTTSILLGSNGDLWSSNLLGSYWHVPRPYLQPAPLGEPPANDLASSENMASLRVCVAVAIG